ncbi:hypothetical protein COV24_00975 [candidate division WWE3 bacterium CG10_big_fil_rev_8_21_14_0_10_32_10]|uniref:Uncharacterized protein n=1 Tax=candidate division WWE3 bacterium CG10_big_fil_rev_8_21_14_0_10_32_10 TaxID=1975090 RepID=A0A2H0RBD8_UNCKA|nr:MAG: hypothetical protein COV24_00975 [candidate division WWE3 bacterium CG10_big_fil_rev_8_21_14_0_10_32_10]
MFTKLIDIYKIYFAISLLVALVLLLGHYNDGLLVIILIIVGALLTPFIYELDYLLYAYVVDPSAPVSSQLQNLIKGKNYKGAFLYAHENTNDFDSTVFRSILMVVSAFGIGFLLIFSPVNILARSVILSFILTTIYLEIVSFTDGSWENWYSFFDTPPKEIYAKVFIGLQIAVFMVFLFKVL